MKGPLAEADSVTYGINYESVLNQLEHFHVCNNQLPQDIMHVLLEGAIPYTMKAMLYCFVIENKFVSINTINEIIQSFKYSVSESSDKPCPLSSNSLEEGRIHQTGMYSELSVYSVEDNTNIAIASYIMYQVSRLTIVSREAKEK